MYVCTWEVYNRGVHRNMGSVRQDYICMHVLGVYDRGVHMHMGVYDRGARQTVSM